MGLTTHAVSEALGDGPLASPFVTAKLQRIGGGLFEPEFALALALKDIRLALDVTGGDHLPAMDRLAAVWGETVDCGLGGRDVTIVSQAL